VSWPKLRLKYLADINERSLSEDEPQGLEFRYVDISAVGRGRLVAEPVRMQFGEAPSRARRLVRPGDTIVSTVRTYLRAVWPVTEPTDDLVVSTGFAVLSPRLQLDPRFLAWWAQSDGFIGEVVARSVGVSYPAIRAEEIGEIPIAVPGDDEQREIADFLDAETARIDALIERKLRLIALVTQRHSTRIDRLITDETAPRHRLSRILAMKISDGPHETPEFLNEGVPFLSVDNVVDGRLVFNDTRKISFEAHRRYALKCVPRRGDVIVTKAAAIGRVALVETDREFNIWSPLAVLRPDLSQVQPEFLYYVMLTTAVQDQIQLIASSNTQQNVAMADLASLRVPVPPLLDQRRIATSLAADRCRADELRGRLERQIDLLREHRQALITAAVTGELDITKAAA
jgi:type I restriction enzyme S subunit